MGMVVPGLGKAHVHFIKQACFSVSTRYHFTLGRGLSTNIRRVKAQCMDTMHLVTFSLFCCGSGAFLSG